MSSEPAPAAAPLPRGALRLAAFLPYRLNVVSAVASEGLARIYPLADTSWGLAW